MVYDICTYCGKSYLERKPFIKSWQIYDNIRHVYVYTDCDVPNEGKLIFRNHFSECINWVENVCRKIYAVQNLLKDTDSENILLIDTDCLILKDPSFQFEIDGDFGVKLVPHTPRYKSSAVLFIQNNNNGRDFVDKWVSMMEYLLQMKMGITPFMRAADEISLDVLVGDLNWKFILGSEFNHRVCRGSPFKNITPQNIPYILHFCGRSYRRSDVKVAEFFEKAHLPMPDFFNHFDLI